ncbi:MAG: hypothetical protein QG641_1849, partial [Candidatus Poribacteria bacterium]|nr:hypothetical protein [Candidatus Poribacteria bacterium]
MPIMAKGLDMKIHNDCIRLDSSILRKIGYITIYLYIICITMVGCGPGARPPAEKPIFVSSGALITESGVTRELGKLEEHTGWWGNHINNFYVDNVIASPRAYSMSFYVTIRYPWLTKLKASYNSAAITWVDPPDTQFISYTVGPRPYPELENAVSNGENIMWVHGNVNLNVSSPDVTFAIVIGAGNPVDLSALEFWTESSNPD